MQEQTQTTNEAQNQRRAVKEIIEAAGKPLRTDEIRLIAFKLSISCADTYLRMLARENEIARFWEVKPTGRGGKLERTNKTKFWSSNSYFEENIKPHLNKKYVQ